MDEKVTTLATTGTQALSIVPNVDIAEVIQTNLGGELSVRDLDRIKLPSGGGLAFEIPTISGPDSSKTFEGVIIFHQSQNAYWSQSVDETGGGTPPDCSSPDAKFGSGTPGGACATCPLNKFGSDDKGDGKACKNTKALYVLPAGHVLPVAIVVPPTSLKAVTQYFMAVTNNSLPYYGVKTRFTLSKEKNKKGIEYSKLVLSAIEVNPNGATSREKIALSESDLAGIKVYRDAIIPQIENVLAATQDTVAE